MNIELIVTVILILYLQKSSLTYEAPPQWKRPFKWGLLGALILFILDVSELMGDVWVKLLSLSLVGVVIYAIFRFPELSKARQLVFAWLPILIVSLIIEFTELVFPSFYKEWDSYFDTVFIFALIWAFAMWINNNKQRKAMEREKIKSLAMEQEIKVTEAMKQALEVQVIERTAALTLQKEELEKALTELKSTQDQLIHAEKMASLGELTAGIAHEIQNPLNFVNNFSEVSSELIDEMAEELKNGEVEEACIIAQDIKMNLDKIMHHGKRADAIVKGMLMHSRNNSSEKSKTNLNALADEYLRLSYHGLRAKDKSFNATFKLNLDPTIPEVEVVPQDIGRVLLNLINNAFYAVNEQAKFYREKQMEDYSPTVTVTTCLEENNLVKLTISDNGPGIPESIRTKVFQPFFTTKPTGEGTGLGLSLSYDIIKAHGGDLKVEALPPSDESLQEIATLTQGTAFTITLPVK